MKLQNLHDWLRTEKLSAAKWGEKLGIGSRASAARYVKGERHPPPDVIVGTYVLSNGRVPPADWFDLPTLATPGSTITESQRDSGAAE